MPPKRSTRSSNKKDEDTKKKDDEVEDEEEEEKPAKGKGKTAAKGKASAKDTSPKKKDDDDDKPEARRSTRAKASDKKKDDNDDDDDKIKDEKKPSAKDKRKADTSPPKAPAKQAAKKQKSKDDDDDDKKDTKISTKKDIDDEDDKKDDVKMVKKIVKGGAAVDEKFDEKNCHVYVTPSKIYACVLNQSNLQHNNNKFYIIQILESDTQKGTYWTWNRWGRVGADGQTAKKRFSDPQAAIADYESKYRDKAVKGDYKPIDIKFDDEAPEEEEEKRDEAADDKKSKLPGATKELIKLIFDLKMMDQQMKEIGYDAKKMPLGKLSKDAIHEGYKILKKISEEVKRAKPDRANLIALSSEFYTNIPHDFGFQQMINQLIDNEDKVKKKLEMLQSIEDIQVATRILDDKSKNKDESLYD